MEQRLPHFGIVHHIEKTKKTGLILIAIQVHLIFNRRNPPDDLPVTPGQEQSHLRMFENGITPAKQTLIRELQIGHVARISLIKRMPELNELLPLSPVDDFLNLDRHGLLILDFQWLYRAKYMHRREGSGITDLPLQLFEQPPDQRKTVVQE